jgi:hypothetical protein
MDPVAFRRNLNSLIPELRNISWLVQKQKSSLTSFDHWYPQWQGRAKESRVMRWIVASRNRVVKEGDLELASTMTAKLQYDWLHEVGAEFKVPPRTTTEELLSLLVRVEKEEESPVGLLTVRRSWRDYSLPDYELLNVLAEAYRGCADLVFAAHEGYPTAPCLDDSLWPRECIASNLELDATCMRQARDYYEMAIDLADMGVRATRVRAFDVDDIAAEQAWKRYGMPEPPTDGDVIAKAQFFLDLGEAILRKDGYLVMTAHFFVGPRPVDFSGFLHDDHTSVVRAMNQIAERAREIEADGVIVSSEMWMATYDENQLHLRPTDRKDRFEALCIDAASADGRLKTLLRRFDRDENGHPVFHEAKEIAQLPASLEPLRKAWKLPRWRMVET